MGSLNHFIQGTFKVTIPPTHHVSVGPYSEVQVQVQVQVTMSSVPGRSDSQRSYTKGDDEISVRKVQEDERGGEGRKSGVGSMRSEGSSSPSAAGGEAATHDSCA